MNDADPGPPAVSSRGDLSKIVPLSTDGAKLLVGDDAVDKLVERLLEKDFEVDAIKVLCHSLPIRQVVWWATLCAWHGADGKPGRIEDAALGAAVRWVVEPTREHRTAAQRAADLDQLNTPGGCCAKSASLAGECPDLGSGFVPVSVLSAARVATGAILTARHRAELEGRAASFRQLVFLGQSVAAGALPWKGQEA